MKVTVKRTHSSPIDYEVNPKLSLHELKLLIQCDFELEPSDQRLVFRGKVLREPETTTLSLMEHELYDGAVIYLVQEAKNSVLQSNNNPTHPDSSTSYASSSRSGTSQPVNLKEASAYNDANDPMMNTLKNPMTDFLLNNPEIFKSLMMADPHMKQMMEKNPEIASIMNNPAVLRDMIKMQMDPKHRKEMTRSNDLAMRNLESVPQAYQELQKLYHKLDEPYQNMQAEYADQFNAAISSSPASNSPASIQRLTSDPLPNPWSPTNNTQSGNNDKSRRTAGNNTDLSNQLQQGFRSFYPHKSSGSERQHQSSSSNQLQTNQFESQLMRMKEMGFDSSKDNLAALTASHGDLDDAITYLMEQLNYDGSKEEEEMNE